MNNYSVPIFPLVYWAVAVLSTANCGYPFSLPTGRIHVFFVFWTISKYFFFDSTFKSLNPSVYAGISGKDFSKWGQKRTLSLIYI